MNIPTGVSAMLQVIAALLIFVASYLALMVCTIACLAVAECFSKRADVVQQYGADSTPAGSGTVPAASGMSRRSGLAFRPHLPKRV
jgi:hypothetical protein